MAHQIDAGALDQRVTIDAPTVSRGASGQESITWAPLATVWARVIPTTARERMNANQVLANIDARIHVRYSSEIAGIGAKHRIRHGAVVYNVSGPPANLDSRKVLLEILCRTGDNEG